MFCTWYNLTLLIKCNCYLPRYSVASNKWHYSTCSQQNFFFLWNMLTCGFKPMWPMLQWALCYGSPHTSTMMLPWACLALSTAAPTASPVQLIWSVCSVAVIELAGLILVTHNTGTSKAHAILIPFLHEKQNTFIVIPPYPGGRMLVFTPQALILTYLEPLEASLAQYQAGKPLYWPPWVSKWPTEASRNYFWSNRKLPENQKLLLAASVGQQSGLLALHDSRVLRRLQVSNCRHLWRQLCGTSESADS